MKEYLPLGSIVQLQGSEKRYMIYGRLQMEPQNHDRLWDYVGCQYPEGNINPDESLLFNHDLIERVYFIGFQDREEFEYKQQLLSAWAELTGQAQNA